MDYGALLKRSWNLIWKHTHLIVLGILVALGNGSAGTSSGGNVSRSLRTTVPSGPSQFPEIPQIPQLPQQPFELPAVPPFRGFALPALSLGLILALVAIVVLLGLAVWVVSTIARGGLVHGVDSVEGGGTSSFGKAFGAGWKRGWTLIGIGILPSIPGLVLAVVAIVTALMAFGIYSFSTTPGAMTNLTAVGVLSVIVPVVCIAIAAAVVLGVLRTFAERASMLEGLGVWASYKRGYAVLIGNFGEALVLFLIQVVLSFLVGVLLMVPSVLLALCCFLWPLLLVIQGAIAAYFSTLWTLAWRQWTARGALPQAAEAQSAR